ncbi:MAG: M56 family metallopeptidase [Lachnospiraceae bacterium]|nr:M56 family metallopeptidase [Lachnospiraceae bacterium]
MSQEIFLRGLGSCVFSFIMAWLVFSRYNREMGRESTETGSERAETDGQKYLPYIPGSLLPLYLLLLLVLETVFCGITGAAKSVLSVCFGIFLHISVYYFILMLVLPFVRKHISARACAMLWVLPNYLYITLQSYMRLPRPLLVLSAPGNLVWILFGIWFVGFFVVLTGKTLQHLAFHRQILRDAVPVTDLEILSAWEEAIEEAQIKKPKFKLVASPHVRTPLSVGLFRRTMRVVLPQKDYEPEELSLILKHEIIHIAREDSWTKYFLVFCTAMCWFNPLMWIAMKKSAEDMELSCDETVLLDADAGTRKKYAALLLDTAGDDRGFTTCLSASASAMRYRLKSIVKPVKRRSGALIVGLVFFLLCMTSGYVSLVYGGATGAEIIYQSGDYSGYHLWSVGKGEGGYSDAGIDLSIAYDFTDEAAFHEYLAGLTLSEFTGNYSFSKSSTEFIYLLDTPDGLLGIDLCDNYIKLTYFAEDYKQTGYYITEGVDWEYLGTVIVGREE